MPCPHSNTKVFRTVENEPLGDITRSDVKGVVANNNTKQLLTDRSGTETESGTTHIYYLKGDRVLGNSILRNSSNECQNQDQHGFIARTNTDWSAICFKIMTRYTCGFFPRILAIIPATRYTLSLIHI